MYKKLQVCFVVLLCCLMLFLFVQLLPDTSSTTVEKGVAIAANVQPTTRCIKGHVFAIAYERRGSPDYYVVDIEQVYHYTALYGVVPMGCD